MFNVFFRIKKRLSLMVSAIFLIIFGIVFILSSIYIYLDALHMRKNGIETQATIVQITSKGTGEDQYFTVLVEYSIEDIIYQNYLGTYTSSMDEGDIIMIRYLPDNINKIAYAKLEYLPAILFFSFGFLANIAGFICFIIHFKRIN